MITGLNHFTIAVSNLERSINFYVNVLEGKLRVKWEQGAYIEFGTLWLALNLDETYNRTIEDKVSHIAFNVAEECFNAFKAKLIHNGCAEYRINKSEGDSYYFKDPDGYHLEIHVGNLESRIEWIKSNRKDAYEIFD